MDQRQSQPEQQPEQPQQQPQQDEAHIESSERQAQGQTAEALHSPTAQEWLNEAFMNINQEPAIPPQGAQQQNEQGSSASSSSSSGSGTQSVDPSIEPAVEEAVHDLRSRQTRQRFDTIVSRYSQGVQPVAGAREFLPDSVGQVMRSGNVEGRMPPAVLNWGGTSSTSSTTEDLLSAMERAYPPAAAGDRSLGERIYETTNLEDTTEDVAEDVPEGIDQDGAEGVVEEVAVEVPIQENQRSEGTSRQLEQADTANQTQPEGSTIDVTVQRLQSTLDELGTMTESAANRQGGTDDSFQVRVLSTDFLNPIDSRSGMPRPGRGLPPASYFPEDRSSSRWLRAREESLYRRYFRMPNPVEQGPNRDAFTRQQEAAFQQARSQAAQASSDAATSSLQNQTTGGSRDLDNFMRSLFSFPVIETAAFGTAQARTLNESAENPQLDRLSPRPRVIHQGNTTSRNGQSELLGWNNLGRLSQVFMDLEQQPNSQEDLPNTYEAEMKYEESHAREISESDLVSTSCYKPARKCGRNDFSRRSSYVHPDWHEELLMSESDPIGLLFANPSQIKRKRVNRELGKIGLLIFNRLHSVQNNPDAASANQSDYFGDPYSRGIPCTKTNLLCFISSRMLHSLNLLQTFPTTTDGAAFTDTAQSHLSLSQTDPILPTLNQLSYMIRHKYVTKSELVLYKMILDYMWHYLQITGQIKKIQQKLIPTLLTFYKHVISNRQLGMLLDTLVQIQNKRVELLQSTGNENEVWQPASREKIENCRQRFGEVFLNPPKIKTAATGSFDFVTGGLGESLPGKKEFVDAVRYSQQLMKNKYGSNPLLPL